MAVKWMDVDRLSFNHLLLLERVQLSWFPGWVPEAELAVALQANPVVAWYLRHKCPALTLWLDDIMVQHAAEAPPPAIRNAELAVLQAINDLLVYVVDPSVYDAQPFLQWDSRELTSLVDFSDLLVADVGAGTGRLGLVAAPRARTVFAFEPVANLRAYLKSKAQRQGVGNLYVVDGLITDIPFPDDFFDVTMGGHVFGDAPVAEYAELQRITRPGGLVVLCPGNRDEDNAVHAFLLARGFAWSRFEEPQDGWVRKYWLRKQ